MIHSTRKMLRGEHGEVELKAFVGVKSPVNNRVIVETDAIVSCGSFALCRKYQSAVSPIVSTGYSHLILILNHTKNCTVLYCIK